MSFVVTVALQLRMLFLVKLRIQVILAKNYQRVTHNLSHAPVQAHSYVLHGSQLGLVTTPLYNAYNCYVDLFSSFHIKVCATSKVVASDMLSSQSDATFQLIIVSSESLNEVDTRVVDGVRVDTNSGVNDFVAPIVDGPHVDTNLASEYYCSVDQSIESQEVQADPRVCPGLVLEELRAGPGVCQGPIMAPTKIGDVGTVLSPISDE
ncbi:hypothetical protein V6N11_084302 [Hibiscus sabdariffa]|uniref:Uncharacterized protein n=1 Tax=Hibiscus sabdariffa TaxID=183260 RepID=A0ABR2QSS0_9ROSI